MHSVEPSTGRLGRTLYWLLLLAVAISTINAIVRKSFDMSSNAYLEMQWYLFAAVFMLGAGYAFLHDQHVRIDVITELREASAREREVAPALPDGTDGNANTGPATTDGKRP